MTHRRSTTRAAARAWMAVALAVTVPVGAQKPAPAAANLSLDELSALPVTIASVANRTVREQPGIVTLITEQDIAAMGARDLMDILALVPGFSFGTDVDATVGADFRGLWAYEGKLLVLLDGVAVNEGLYGTVQFGHHYPAALIRQVEVIRGPGSARYGGNAELAVISITTKGAEQQGGLVSVRPELVSGRTGVSLDGHLGYTLAHDWRLSLGAHYERFIRSDQTFVALNGQRVDMKRRSTMTPSMVIASLGWRDLELRALYDNYHFANPTGFGNPSLQTTPWSETFNTLMASAKYEFRLSPRLTITPRLTFDRQHPWWLHTSAGQGDFELRVDKRILDVPGVFALNPRNHLLVGVTGYSERATAIETSPFFGQAAPGVFFNGARDVSYRDASVYAQYDLDTKWANVSIGARWESHDYAGSEVVPRASVTRLWKNFHFKLLYDEAFRTPNIETIQQRLGGTSIGYEKTASHQVEVGYQFADRLSMSANVFHVRVERPLAFTVVSNTQFGYINGTPIGGNGGEVEMRYERTPFSVDVGYSYYRAQEQLSESLGLYGSSVDGLNLALPAHRFSFNGTYRIRPALSWNVNGTALSRSRAFAYPGGETWLPAELNVNSYVEYRSGQLTVGLGGWNLLNQSVELGQPYNGGHAPLPLLRRNYSVKLSWLF